MTNIYAVIIFITVRFGKNLWIAQCSDLLINESQFQKKIIERKKNGNIQCIIIWNLKKAGKKKIYNNFAGVLSTHFIDIIYFITWKKFN